MFVAGSSLAHRASDICFHMEVPPQLLWVAASQDPYASGAAAVGRFWANWGQYRSSKHHRFG